MIFNYSSKRSASAHDDDDNDDDDDDDLFERSKSSSKKAKVAAKPVKKKAVIDDSDDDDDSRKKAAKVDEDDDVEIVQTHAECAKKALEELLAGSSSSGVVAAKEIDIDDDADEVAKTSKETLARIAKLKGGLEQTTKGIDMSMAAAASTSSSSSNQRRSSLPTKSSIMSFEERQRIQQEKKTELLSDVYESIFGESLLSSKTGASSSSSSAKASTVDQGKSIKIKVVINSNHELGFKLFARQRFSEVKNRLAEMTGVIVSKIRLQSDAEDIEDDQTAEGLELEDDYAIEMFIPKEEYSNAVQNAKDWKDRPKGGPATNGTNKPPVAEPSKAEPPKVEPTVLSLILIFAVDIIKNEEKKDPITTKVLPDSTLQELEEKLITARAMIGLKDELKNMSFFQNKTELRLDKTIRDLGCVDGTEIHVQARPISITVSFPEGILAEGTEAAVKLKWKDSFQKIVKFVEKQKKASWIYSVDGIDVKSYQYSSPVYALGMEEGTLVKVRQI